MVPVVQNSCVLLAIQILMSFCSTGYIMPFAEMWFEKIGNGTCETSELMLNSRSLALILV